MLKMKIHTPTGQNCPCSYVTARKRHGRPLFECVRVDLYTRESYAFHPFLLPRCPYEKDIFISVDRGEALCSRVKNEHQRKSKKKNEGGKKGEKELRARVKGKSANPVRRSHYRLGFDCSGSAGTGATRYTLYSASVRFLEIYSEKESIHTGTHPSCSWTHVYVYKYIYCYPSTGLCSSRKERGEGKRARQGMSVDLWLCPTENPWY